MANDNRIPPLKKTRSNRQRLPTTKRRNLSKTAIIKKTFSRLSDFFKGIATMLKTISFGSIYLRSTKVVKAVSLFQKATFAFLAKYVLFIPAIETLTQIVSLKMIISRLSKRKIPNPPELKDYKLLVELKKILSHKKITLDEFLEIDKKELEGKIGAEKSNFLLKKLNEKKALVIKKLKTDISKKALHLTKHVLTIVACVVALGALLSGAPATLGIVLMTISVAIAILSISTPLADSKKIKKIKTFIKNLFSFKGIKKIFVGPNSLTHKISVITTGKKGLLAFSGIAAAITVATLLRRQIVKFVNLLVHLKGIPALIGILSGISLVIIITVLILFPFMRGTVREKAKAYIKNFFSIEAAKKLTHPLFNLARCITIVTAGKEVLDNNKLAGHTPLFFYTIFAITNFAKKILKRARILKTGVVKAVDYIRLSDKKKLAKIYEKLYDSYPHIKKKGYRLTPEDMENIKRSYPKEFKELEKINNRYNKFVIAPLKAKKSNRLAFAKALSHKYDEKHDKLPIVILHDEYKLLKSILKEDKSIIITPQDVKAFTKMKKIMIMNSVKEALEFVSLTIAILLPILSIVVLFVAIPPPVSICLIVITTLISILAIIYTRRKNLRKAVKIKVPENVIKRKDNDDTR